MENVYNKEPLYHSPSSQPPVSITPQHSLTGSGEACSPQHVYAQPDMCMKQIHQQYVGEGSYSRTTTNSPLLATSMDSDSKCNHPDFLEASQTLMPAIADPEYADDECDEYIELPCTLKLEYRVGQPASQATTTEYYNVVATDKVSNNSHQCTPHTLSHDTPVLYENVRLVTYEESRTRQEALFEDPTYATPFSHYPSDSGNRIEQFQFPGHYKIDPHFQRQK